ncbi:MAG: hypothetical protein AAB675_03135 [Patescibacteria group bacterium]
MTERAKLRVTYGKRIRHQDTPYSISVDSEGIVGLLTNESVSKEDISRLKIRINSNLQEDAGGIEYDDPNNIEISVDAEEPWSQFDGALTEARDIQRGKKVKPRSIQKLLYTKKLPAYLKAAPKERGYKTASKLISNGASRELNGTLIHELRHAVHLFTGKYRFWYSNLGASIVDFLDFARYVIDPSEREASKFEREKRNDPELRDLIRIYPK